MIKSKHIGLPYTSGLVFWFVVQCRQKIHQRFNLSEVHWRVQPWVTMVDWELAADDKFAPAQIELPVSTRDSLSELGLLPTPNEVGLIPLNRDTVECWITCLGKLLTEAKTLAERTDSSSLLDFAQRMLCIDDILEQHKIQDLFRMMPSLSRALRTSACSCCSLPCYPLSSSPAAAYKPSNDSTTANVDPQDIQENDNSNEDPGRLSDPTLH